jgi:hypothetical protein
MAYSGISVEVRKLQTKSSLIVIHTLAIFFIEDSLKPGTRVACPSIPGSPLFTHNPVTCVIGLVYCILRIAGCPSGLI